MNRNKSLSVLLIVGVFALVQAHTTAATIAYWQFDDGAAGNAANTVVTQVNSPALDGTGVSEGSGLPTFSSDTPSGEIIDPAAGAMVNNPNTTSLKLTNTGLPGNPNSHNASVIQVDGSNALLKPATFTIELFVKLDRPANFAGIIGKERVDENGSSWQLDMNDSGKVRARFDTQALGTGGNGVTGYNQSYTTSLDLTDGEWHHIAMTYDASTRDLVIYGDYVQVGNGTTAFNLVYDDDPFEIGHVGGRGFDGWVDEVRLSDTVLAPSQFLVIPEPTSLALLIPGGLLIARRR